MDVRDRRTQIRAFAMTFVKRAFTLTNSAKVEADSLYPGFVVHALFNALALILAVA